VEQARDGLVTVLLTGKGEPLLAPDEITEYLDCLNFRFPLVDLQTNGILLKSADENGYLTKWLNNGLSLVCISIAHHDPVVSNRLMGIEAQYRFWDDVERLKALGLGVRLNCTMLKSGIHRPEQVNSLIGHCASAGVDQLTLREVEMPSDARDQDVAEWVREEKPVGAARRLRHHLEMRDATRLLELPHGGIVYDVDGQNVCVSNCLTGTTDPDDIRQIIYFPDGRIAYDWRYPGARIL
jgi:molybdenum cofactor biosynthesis enzyme MoaA